MADHRATIDKLAALLGDRLKTGSGELDQHAGDEGSYAPIRPDAVAYPRDTAEVSEIVKLCAAGRCPIIPYGVGTSLEGHVIPVRGGVTLDMSHMNSVLEVNDADLNAVVQPGVTRVQLNDELRASGLMFTVDPGANATLGGMASTRASGTNTVRYGTIRENVLALEVVLADGRIIRTGSKARKSASGYDLTHLMIGAEGTLGIITELTVKLWGVPEAISAATCAFDDIDAAVNAVILAIQSGLPMARIELMDEVQARGINIYNPDLSLPEKPHLLLEFHGSPATVEEQAEAFGEIAAEFGASDFKWATRTEERNRLWKMRHEAYYAAKSLRPGVEGLTTDVCVPISALAHAIGEAKRIIAECGLVAPLVGHVGDGNFHLITLLEPGNDTEKAAATEMGHRLAALALELGGTVTGEHGIGFGKLKYMSREHGDAWDVMAQVKRALDPQNILNPGKVVQIN